MAFKMDLHVIRAVSSCIGI